MLRSVGTLIKIAYRNIWRSRRRSFFCLAAVGLAVFFLVFYGSFQDGQINGIETVVKIFNTGHVKVVSERYDEDYEQMPVQYPVSNGENVAALVNTVKTIPGVQAVLPRIEAYATLQDSVLKNATLWGLNIEDELKINHFNMTDRSSGLTEGRFPEPLSNECAVGYIFSEKTGLTIGDRIPLKTVSAQFSDRYWSPVITGIYNFDYLKYDERVIIVDFQRLQQLLVLGGGTQQLVIYTDEKNSAGIASKAEELLGKGNAVQEWQDNIYVAMIRTNRLQYWLIFTVFIVVACLLIINTVVMIINERIKEIGMMGSLGMTRTEIVIVFFFESVLMSAIGAFIGVLLGGIVTGILQHYPLRIRDMVGNSMSDFPMSNVIILSFSVLSLVRAWFAGVFVASVFTLIPSLKCAFVEPVEALRR